MAGKPSDKHNNLCADDGSTGKGFHFRSKDFGNLMEGCDEYALGVIVSPEWFVYGK